MNIKHRHLRPREPPLDLHSIRRAILENRIHRRDLLNHAAVEEGMVLRLIGPVLVRANIVRGCRVDGRFVEWGDVEQDEVAPAVGVDAGDLVVHAVGVGR